MRIRLGLQAFFFVALSTISSLNSAQVNKQVRVGDTVFLQMIDVPDLIFKGYHVPPRFKSMEVWHTSDNFLLYSELHASEVKVYAMPHIIGTHTDSITIKAHYEDGWYAGAIADCTYTHAITIEAIESLSSHVTIGLSEPEFELTHSLVTLSDPGREFLSLELIDLLGRSVASSDAPSLALPEFLSGPFFLVIRHRSKVTLKKILIE